MPSAARGKTPEAPSKGPPTPREEEAPGPGQYTCSYLLEGQLGAYSIPQSSDIPNTVNTSEAVDNMLDTVTTPYCSVYSLFLFQKT